MSGLGHYLEDEGLATVIIALVREHAEKIRPPRALWVPFPLGRPFGVPNDAGFQRRVLAAALALLDREAGPVLEDFPEDAPDDSGAGDDDMAGWVCPVSFPAPPPPEDRSGPLAAVLAEIDGLAPWYELAYERRGRTAVGLTGLPLKEVARFADGFVAGDRATNPVEGAAMADALRWSGDDLKAYYFEAATARPGHASQKALTNWFWRETACASLIQALRRACMASSDAAIHDVGDFMLVADAYAEPVGE